MEEQARITEVLDAWRRGEPFAAEELAELVHSELRRLSGIMMRRERGHHTLTPTALVNEAYLKLHTLSNRNWSGRVHFFRTAALLMRRILVDHARSRQAECRKADIISLPTDPNLGPSVKPVADPDLIALDKALRELEQKDPNLAHIVELKFFGGLTIEEIAEALETSEPTVKRAWNVARGWLHTKLGPHEPIQ